MKMFRLFFIAIFFLCRHNCWPQQVTVHFEGTIFDEKNEIIKGAVVKITQGELPFNVIKSDENGSYNVYLPLNGEYDITVTKEGYAQKKYFVNTKNIPAEKSQIQFATNVAHVVLFTKYEKVDYSLFEKPISRYYYEAGKDNVVYDEEYLKMMKQAMKDFKNAQEEAKKQAEEKAEGDKRIAENLAYEKAKADKAKEKSMAAQKAADEKAMAEKIASEKTEAEKLNAEKLAAERKKTEEKPAVVKAEPEKAKEQPTVALKEEPFVKSTEKNISATVEVDQKPNKTTVTSGTVIKKDVQNPRIAELLNKYKPGITEEIFQGEGVYIIQRVVVRDEMVWIYQKKIFTWGGVTCNRDKQPITEGIFELETKKG